MAGKANKKVQKDDGTSKRVAIYVRVSTQHQVERVSLPVQREELTNYAKYVLGIDSYEIFEDAGYSAKNTDRPDYQRMMSRVRTGEFSHILVWKIDRISRNLLDFSSMYAELKLLGVTFVSKNEQFDTSSAMGEAMLKIILVFAELERNMTSERVSSVMLSRASDGVWNGGRVPFGYSYDKESKTFSVREDEAAVVRLAYDSYLKNRSLVAVSKELNSKGFRSRKGAEWNPVTVRKLLISPFYVGTYRYNYYDESVGKKFRTKDEAEWVLVDDHHPAIIEPEMQKTVVSILVSRQRGAWTQDTRYGKNVHIFAGLLTCGVCGSNMTATKDRERASGDRVSMYLCSHRRRFSTCDNKYVTDLSLGPFVLSFLTNLIKASNSFGRSTSVETFTKKLLRGDELACVDHIGEAGILEFYQYLKSGFDKHPFSKPEEVSAQVKEGMSERDVLLSEIRKHERALNRLQSIYLYDEETMSEKDFILRRTEITDKIAIARRRVEEIDSRISAAISMTDEDFFEKTSYFILSQELLQKRNVDYKKFILAADPLTLKNFIKKVTTNFCIKNGRVDKMRLKNGIELQFFYKSE